MTTKALARLHHGPSLDLDAYMTITPPVLDTITPLCKIGHDATGDKLLNLLESTGPSRNVNTKPLKNARQKSTANDVRTALAILPIYQDGRRGCFFDAASNDVFDAKDLGEMLDDVVGVSSISGASGGGKGRNKKKTLGAFLFGYPHLLPKLQGVELSHLFRKARGCMEDGGLIVMDLNGVPERKWERGLRTVADLKTDAILGAALEHVDILHLNEEELVFLTGCDIQGKEETQLDDEFQIASACSLFLMCGVAVVAVTRGKRGCFISCNDEDRFVKSPMLPSSWIDCTTKLSPMEFPSSTILNTNGAGDAFTAGLLVAAMLRHTGMTCVTSSQTTEQKDLTSPTDPTTALDDDYASSDLSELEKSIPRLSQTTGNNRRRLTPYSLYMREHYIELKKQCKDDKKAIFTKCHDMWENESAEVKSLYERKCAEDMEDDEELERQQEGGSGVASDNYNNSHDNDDGPSSINTDDYDTNVLPPPTPPHSSSSLHHHHHPEDHVVDDQRNMYLANRALNLESAAQFANLVAGYHIDLATRDETHLDISVLLERAMIFPHGLEEI